MPDLRTLMALRWCPPSSTDSYDERSPHSWTEGSLRDRGVYSNYAVKNLLKAGGEIAGIGV
jgi:hypothetical protein